jgi:ribose transport system substrate-binding protein
MKRRTFIQTSIAAAAASAVFKPFFIKAQSKKYVFGFSQCTIVEPWRVQFNKHMNKEADKHPEVELFLQMVKTKRKNR